MIEKTELPTVDAGDERCETCRFWLPEDDVPESAAGLCVRFPPVFIGGKGGHVADYSQPWVLRQEGCGEWRPKKPKTAKLPPCIPLAAPRPSIREVVDGLLEQAGSLGVSFGEITESLYAAKNERALIRGPKGESAIKTHLHSRIDDGEVERTGKGVVGDPYRYRLTAVPDSV